MKANELRIGNFYQWHTVDGKVNQLRVEIEDFHNNDWNDFEPIPLTPEWLERAGFRTVNEDERIGFYLIVNGCRLLGLKFCNDPINLSLNWNGTTITPDIRYVHALQNLYHALTGKELEFNLDNLN